MFVLQSTYQKLLNEHRELAEYNNRLLNNWNHLVKRINAKGGEDFLNNATLTPPPVFSQKDILRLLQLCHPDKHDGKPMAVEMTQKLLSLKE